MLVLNSASPIPNLVLHKQCVSTRGSYGTGILKQFPRQDERFLIIAWDASHKVAGQNLGRTFRLRRPSLARGSCAFRLLRLAPSGWPGLVSFGRNPCRLWLCWIALAVVRCEFFASKSTLCGPWMGLAVVAAREGFDIASAQRGVNFDHRK